MFGHSNAHGSNGSTINYYKWVTGKDTRVRQAPRRAPTPVAAWQAIPGAYFNDFKLMGTTIEQSARSQDNWHLADYGQGAVSFVVDNAGGNFVVYLTANNHSDVNGYFIVLDDDNHESYVLQVASLGSNRLRRETMANDTNTQLHGRRSYVRVANVRVDPLFRMQSDSPQSFWLVHTRDGAITVGKGASPNASTGQILHMPAQNTPLRNGAAMYHFGFARLGSRWRVPIIVRDVVSYKYTRAVQVPAIASNLPVQRVVQRSLVAPDKQQPMSECSPLMCQDKHMLMNLITNAPSAMSSSRNPQPNLYGPRPFPPSPLRRGGPQ